MNEKLNNALANIDEELIYEAANAGIAGRSRLKALLPPAAAAAVLALAVGTRSIWHPVLFGESGGEAPLVDNTPTEGVDLLPAAEPLSPKSDGKTRLSELLAEDGETETLVGAAAVEMTEEKTMEIYFGSNFPMLIYAGDDIAVFSDGFDSSLYFYNIAQPKLGGAMLCAIDLTETINSANSIPDTGLPYDNIGYSYGGQTNGISAFAAEKDGAVGIFLSVGSYDDTGSATTLYRIVQSGDFLTVKKIASTAEGKSFPELLEGWEVIEAKTGGQYFELADGRKVTTGLSGFDFANFTIEVTEGETTCILYPFVLEEIEETEGEITGMLEADDEPIIPDLVGGNLNTAAQWLKNADYEYTVVYVRDAAANGTVLRTELDEEGTFRLYVSVGEEIGQEEIAEPEISAEQTEITANEGGFVLPLAADSGWYVLEPTCADGGYYSHKGVDLAADFGTPIYAAKDGTVVLSEYYDGYGKCVIVEHDNGLSTVYGHCSELFAEPGDEVSAGDRIASVGSTGYVAQAALHFEIRQDNEPVSHPMEYIEYYPENSEVVENPAE